jgi:hypothetical protein
LHQTYEETEGKAVGRSQVFEDYLDFCSRAGYLPTNNAALGRLFKVRLPSTPSSLLT